MNRMGKRRFRLFDVILFVAATALGLAGWLHHLRQVPNADDFPSRMPDCESSWMIFLSILCVAWSSAVVVVSMLPPRRAFRRLVRQPGWVACLAAIVVPFASMVNEAFGRVAYGLNTPDFAESWDSYHFAMNHWFLPTNIAPAVCVAWVVLALGRRWKVGAEWVEWFGIALGLYWIVAAPLMHLFWNISE